MKYAVVTEDYIDQLWSHVRRSRGIFGALEGSSREALAKSLFGSYIVLSFDFGYARFTDWIPGTSCFVHFVAWSPRLFRQKGELSIALQHMYAHHGMKRVYVRIPSSSKSLRRLVTSLGFSFESVEPLYYGIGCENADRYVIVFEEG